MGLFATSLCLDLPRNLPSVPTLDWVVSTLFPACKTVESLTVMGGILKNKIQSNPKPRCVRELTLKSFGCTSSFFDNITTNFPCLERLNLTFDMEHTPNNKGISISVPKSRLDQIMIEPKNYGHRLPTKPTLIVYLQTTRQSVPLRYHYVHVSSPTRPSPAQDRQNTAIAKIHKIKVEVGDLQSFLFAFDGLIIS